MASFIPPPLNASEFFKLGWIDKIAVRATATNYNNGPRLRLVLIRVSGGVLGMATAAAGTPNPDNDPQFYFYNALDAGSGVLFVPPGWVYRAASAGITEWWEMDL